MKPSKRKRLVVLTKKIKAAKELVLQTEQQEQEKQLPNGLKELKVESKQEEKVEEKPKKLFGRPPKKDKIEQETEVVVETKEEEEDKVSE